VCCLSVDHRHGRGFSRCCWLVGVVPGLDLRKSAGQPYRVRCVDTSMDGERFCCDTGPLTPLAGGAVAVVGMNPPSTPVQTLEQFLARSSARAFRFAELGLRHREDALDAVQEAMIKMLGYRQRPVAEWTPLFWAILRRKIVDIQRRRTFRLSWLRAQVPVDGGEIDWADEHTPGPARQHESGEVWVLLVRALRNLPHRQREAFSLRVLEEFDVPTTAQIMKCSEGSVKTHLFRAREALKARLKDFQ